MKDDSSATHKLCDWFAPLLIGQNYKWLENNYPPPQTSQSSHHSIRRKSDRPGPIRKPLQARHLLFVVVGVAVLVFGGVGPVSLHGRTERPVPSTRGVVVHSLNDLRVFPVFRSLRLRADVPVAVGIGEEDGQVTQMIGDNTGVSLYIGSSRKLLVLGYTCPLFRNPSCF